MSEPVVLVDKAGGFNSGSSLRDFEQRRESVMERGRSQSTSKR